MKTKDNELIEMLNEYRINVYYTILIVSLFVLFIINIFI